jgi:polysaccharide export outer membrane protein
MRHCLIACMICGICIGQEHSTTANEPTTLNLPANLPTRPFGANDLLLITVYDSPELSRSVRVAADGYIRLPMVKERIRAEGLLPGELEQSIADTLVRSHILVDPAVTVVIAEYHSRPVSVVGAVHNPITFQAATPTTLLEAIAKAGGLEQYAGPEILLTRQETQDGRTQAVTLHIPVSGLISKADPRWNVLLQGGEEIRVPEAGHIFVVGNVKKPGSFATPESGDATVLKAVALSEGLLPFSAKQAFIYRPDAVGAKKEIPIDLTRILNRKSPDIALQPEDVLYIPENKEKKLGAAALERILVFGSTAGATAMVYGR